MKSSNDSLKSLLKEIGSYINSVNLIIKFIPDDCDNIKSISDNNKLKNVLNSKLIAAACNNIRDGEKIFCALMNTFANISDELAKSIYRETKEDIASGTVYPIAGYTEEIKEMVRVNKLANIGFTKKESGKGYNFNANIFVSYFMSRVNICVMENDTFLLYNNKGFYELVDDKIVGKIIRYFMHEVKRNIWFSGYEIEVLRALRLEAVIVKEINSDREYVNLENGLLNTITKELLPHSSEIISTIRIPFIYDRKANCKRFIKFIEEITMNDKELAMVIQEMVGYIFTPETKAEKAFILCGTGSNGKSTLSKVVKKLVGEQNVSTIPLEQFSMQFGLENIIGKIVNIATENELNNSKMSTQNLKAIISGDTINITIKHKGSINYVPICKLIFMLNSLPDTVDNTYGFYRKIEIIPFNKKFIDEDKDVFLDEKLEKELPGILNWALEGLDRLKANNFQFTKSVSMEKVKHEYEQEQNPVLCFYQDCMEIDVEASALKSDVLSAYDGWLKANGLDDKGSKSCQKFWKLFKMVLDRDRQAYAEKKVHGYMHLKGMKLKKEFQNSITFLDV